MTDKPIVYTLQTCLAWITLKEEWAKLGRPFEERQVDENQAWLDEALTYGNSVPIVVYPDGRVEIGFRKMISCYIA